MVRVIRLFSACITALAFSALASASALPNVDRRRASDLYARSDSAAIRPALDDASLLAGLVDYLYKRGSGTGADQDDESGHTVYVTSTFTTTSVSTAYADTCGTGTFSSFFFLLIYVELQLM